MIKSFELKHYANKGKVERIKKVIEIQQENVFTVCEWLSDYYIKNGDIPRFAPDDLVINDSSMRRKDAWNQVRAAFVAYDGLLRYKGKGLIGSLKIEDDELLKELFVLNKNGLWLRPECVKKMTISNDAVEISKVLFEQLVSDNPLPVVGCKPSVSFCHANSLYYRESKNTDNFDHWITLQSDVLRSPIYIPVEENDYFISSGGKVNGTFQFRVDDNGNLVITASKSLPYYPDVERSGELSLDWGFRSLFSTSDGRLLGNRLHLWLLDRDAELQELVASLNRLGVPLKKSKRYRNFNNRIRSYVTNEVGRILNCLNDEGWAEIVVESLDFRGRGFSKRMNRVLQRAGRAAVKNKMADLESRGITISEVNPAFTSQECCNCHFVSSDNRCGKVFACLNCGLKLDADINAARVILSRRSRGNTWLWMSRGEVFRLLEQDFIALNGHDFVTVEERFLRRCYSAIDDGVDKTSTAGRVLAKPAIN